MLIVIPAYGRDYKSAKAVKTDWEAGKDFLIQDMSSPWDGSYVNKQDYNGKVQVYFAKKTKTCVI